MNGTAIPLPQNWFICGSHPTFLDHPLPNNYSNTHTWDPCPGNHSYSWTATFNLETSHDLVWVGSAGGTVPLTGSGTTTFTGVGPLTVSVSTDGSVQSQGLLSMPIQCSDLARPIFRIP